MRPLDFLFPCLLIAALIPDCALASGGITEFSGPLEKVVGTITGPAGKFISIIAMAITGVMYVLNKQELSEGFKMLLGVVFGICFIAFAANIVSFVFSFTGGVI